jgi:hypothetical protein
MTMNKNRALFTPSTPLIAGAQYSAIFEPGNTDSNGNNYNVDIKQAMVISAAAAATQTIGIIMGNQHEKASNNQHRWKFYVREASRSSSSAIAQVEFTLHPTFTPVVVIVTAPPFEISRVCPVHIARVILL